MNSSNSGAAAGMHEGRSDSDGGLQIVTRSGRCIRATASHLELAMVQHRSALTTAAKAAANLRQRKLAVAKADRAAALAVLREIEEANRNQLRFAVRVRVKPVPQGGEGREKPITIRIAPKGRQRSGGSSWEIDAAGMRGVHYQQSYISRKNGHFKPGCARERLLYITRPDAVLGDEHGTPLIFSNLGLKVEEMGNGWDVIEATSKRKNAKIQIEAILAFDADAGLDEQVVALKTFLRTVFEPLDIPYTAAIHAPSATGDQRNVHAHILFNLRPTRRIEQNDWAIADSVVRELDGRSGVTALRNLWAHAQTAAAERAGRDIAYTALAYAARGLDREAGEHIGPARSAQLARGVIVPAAARNQTKNRSNLLRRKLADLDSKKRALVKVRSAMEKRASDRSILSLPHGPSSQNVPCNLPRVTSPHGLIRVTSRRTSVAGSPLIISAVPAALNGGVAPVQPVRNPPAKAVAIAATPKAPQSATLPVASITFARSTWTDRLAAVASPSFEKTGFVRSQTPITVTPLRTEIRAVDIPDMRARPTHPVEVLKSTTRVAAGVTPRPPRPPIAAHASVSYPAMRTVPDVWMPLPSRSVPPVSDLHIITSGTVAYLPPPRASASLELADTADTQTTLAKSLFVRRIAMFDEALRSQLLAQLRFMKLLFLAAEKKEKERAERARHECQERGEVEASQPLLIDQFDPKKPRSAMPAPRPVPAITERGEPRHSLKCLLYVLGRHPEVAQLGADNKLTIALATEVPRVSEASTFLNLWRDDPQIHAWMIEVVKRAQAKESHPWPAQFAISMRQFAQKRDREEEEIRQRSIKPYRGPCIERGGIEF